jgi:hypothetical protein
MRAVLPSRSWATSSSTPSQFEPRPTEEPDLGARSARYRILKHQRPHAVLHDADHCPWLDSTIASPGHQQWARSAVFLGHTQLERPANPVFQDRHRRVERTRSALGLHPPWHCGGGPHRSRWENTPQVRCGLIGRAKQPVIKLRLNGGSQPFLGRRLFSLTSLARYTPRRPHSNGSRKPECTSRPTWRASATRNQRDT